LYEEAPGFRLGPRADYRVFVLFSLYFSFCRSVPSIPAVSTWIHRLKLHRLTQCGLQDVKSESLQCVLAQERRGVAPQVGFESEIESNLSIP
jgi:hypothetical protein